MMRSERVVCLLLLLLQQAGRRRGGGAEVLDIGVYVLVLIELQSLRDFVASFYNK